VKLKILKIFEPLENSGTFFVKKALQTMNRFVVSFEKSLLGSSIKCDWLGDIGRDYCFWKNSELEVMLLRLYLCHFVNKEGAFEEWINIYFDEI